MAADQAPPSGGGDALDDRKLRILRTIVAEYVSSAEPVGSKRVVEVAALDVSPATVRNEMAALEEAGYISQPHTSAGRVPTDKGYRTFVDDLRGHAAVDGSRQELISELLDGARDLEDLLHRTTSTLSKLTKLVSLVIAPTLDASRLKVAELVGLTPTTALLLLVSDTGRVHKRTIELPAPAPEADLERVRAILNQELRGRRMRDLEEVVRGLEPEAPSELRDILHAIVGVTDTDALTEAVRQVFVGGQAALADDQSFERDQLSQVLQLLEERVTLGRILADSSTDDEPFVRIGGEHELEGLHSTSLVGQRYQLVTAGSLGVLGPTRMDYLSVLATVRAVADQLQHTLTELEERD